MCDSELDAAPPSEEKPWDGPAQGVRSYDRALTSAEIAARAFSQPPFCGCGALMDDDGIVLIDQGQPWARRYSCPNCGAVLIWDERPEEVK